MSAHLVSIHTSVCWEFGGSFSLLWTRLGESASVSQQRRPGGLHDLFLHVRTYIVPPPSKEKKKKMKKKHQVEAIVC